MNTIKNVFRIILIITLGFSTGCSTEGEVEELPKEKILVESINIYGGNITDGRSSQLTVDVLPNGATNKSISWSVSDTSVALISELGLLSAVSNGEVVVMATAKDDSGVSTEKTFKISGLAGPVVLVETITILGNDITDGTSQQLGASILPANTSNKTINWSVSDTNIADITSEGFLTPKINGTVTVFASSTDGSEIKGELQLNISGIAPAYATILKAENMLIFQRNNGGWSKKVANIRDYNKELSEGQKNAAINEKGNTDSTIDNDHTVGELRYLLSAYVTTSNPNYLEAVEKALDFLFEAQYDNGGWPQYYPDKSGYRHQITFNDNAMVNVMSLMWDISKNKSNTELIDEKYKDMAITSFNKGIEVILKTQTTVNGEKAAWCAQHDEVTLLPATARSYELPSNSGSESVGVVRTLMLVEQPSSEIIEAVKSAVQWFEDVKLLDIATQNTGSDVIVVSSPGNVIWGRFYDLETNLPFFCGRDGVKKNTLAEIELERRTGYSWYGNWPKNLIGSEYSAWKNRHSL